MSLRQRALLAALMLAATPGLAAVCGIDHSHANTPASKAPARVPAASGPRSKCDAPTRFEASDDGFPDRNSQLVGGRLRHLPLPPPVSGGASGFVGNANSETTRQKVLGRPWG